MTSKFMTFSAVLALALGAAAIIPADLAAEAEAQRRGGPSRADRIYVMKAAASDLYEIQSSEIAARRAERPAVREFAQMLVADHNRTTRLVAEAARADGVNPPPPMLEPRQRTMIRQLERARPREFDRLYLRQQVPAHQEALALHRTYSRRGDGRALRRVAGDAVPIIEGHLAHARRLQRDR